MLKTSLDLFQREQMKKIIKWEKKSWRNLLIRASDQWKSWDNIIENKVTYAFFTIFHIGFPAHAQKRYGISKPWRLLRRKKNNRDFVDVETLFFCDENKNCGTQFCKFWLVLMFFFFVALENLLWGWLYLETKVPGRTTTKIT